MQYNSNNDNERLLHRLEPELAKAMEKLENKSHHNYQSANEIFGSKGVNLSRIVQRNSNLSTKYLTKGTG